MGDVVDLLVFARIPDFRLYLEEVEREGGGIADAVEARSGRRPVS